MLGDGKPLYSRKFLKFYIKFLNRWGLRFNKLSRKFMNKASCYSRHAVVEYHKEKGTWPQPNHIYPEMRGEIK